MNFYRIKFVWWDYHAVKQDSAEVVLAHIPALGTKVDSPTFGGRVAEVIQHINKAQDDDSDFTIELK